MKRMVGRRLAGLLAALAMVVGLMPGMSLQAYAEPTEELLTTITATGKEQASYNPENVASVSFSYSSEGSSAYTAIWGWWGYGWTATVTPAEGYTITKCVFYDDQNRTATDSEAPFVVETTEGDKTPQVNGTPILAYTSKGIKKIEVYGYAKPAHAHNFSYSADGATITATCTADGCTLPPSSEGGTDHVATLTIAKPEHATYGDGKSAEATITDENGIKGTASVAYYKATKSGDAYTKTDVAINGAPTEAGDYVAEITLENVKTSEGEGKSVTASVGYTIAKADPTAAAPTGLTATYGDTLSKVSLTNPEGNTPGTWKWVDAETTSVGNAGENTFKANFTPDSANYKTVSNVDVKVTVNKAASPVQVTDKASVAPGGATVDLAGNVKMNGATGAVSYEIVGDANGCTVSDEGVLTSGQAEGEVTVSVAVAEDDNYKAMDAKTITVAVKRIPVTALAVEPAKDDMLVGDEQALRLTFTPDDATDKSFVIGGYDKSVVAVSEDGVVTAKAEGTTTITFTATNGTDDASDDVTATCTVTVSKPEPKPEPGRAEMFRLYNPYTGEHFYTASAYERDVNVGLGWVDEGVGWVAPTEGAPVFRLYNPYAGDHHYTTSAEERDMLLSVGWSDEGVGWYSAGEDGVALLRQYNPYAVAGMHNYTTSQEENDNLVSLGWVAEGVGWYGLA